ncbi:hypothetical protein SCWH03_20220 [Streptomyces pacificus]|uniref:Transposase n=1 Tax=Streptomyces pacificus TaxID=2705029 RepID=A0A6A0ASA2_9ACTN|nr:hypothetical protein SCWH03_20220 [Streptomyces pacificus]
MARLLRIGRRTVGAICARRVWVDVEQRVDLLAGLTRIGIAGRCGRTPRASPNINARNWSSSRRPTPVLHRAYLLK